MAAVMQDIHAPRSYDSWKDQLFASPPAAPAPIKFGPADVLRAFELLDKTRVQPRFGSEASGGCRYADPETNLPSCIGGTIIAILAPEFFKRSGCAADTSATVRGLFGIYDVFTNEAVLLLEAVQMFADGRHYANGHVGAQMTWGDAMLHGSIRALEDQAQRAMF